VDGGHGSLISEHHAAKFALIYKRVLVEAESSTRNLPQP